MKIGEAFLEFMPQLDAAATSKLQQEAARAGDRAGKAFADAFEREVDAGVRKAENRLRRLNVPTIRVPVVVDEAKVTVPKNIKPIRIPVIVDDVNIKVPSTTKPVKVPLLVDDDIKVPRSTRPVKVPLEPDRDQLEGGIKSALKRGFTPDESLTAGLVQTLRTGVSSAMVSVFTSPFGMTLGVSLVAGLGAAIAGATAFLGGVLTAALVGGLGIGVIAAGIALVADDPRIAEAGKKIKEKLFGTGDTVTGQKNVDKAQSKVDSAQDRVNKLNTLGGSDAAKKSAAYDLQKAKDELAAANNELVRTKGVTGQLKDAAKPFIQPTINALEIFNKTIDRIMPSVSRMFADAAKNVEPLAKGLSGLATNAMPGLEKAVKASGEILGVVAKRLPDIGTAISDFFAKISDEQAIEGAKTALDDLIDLTIWAIGTTGDLLVFLSSEWLKIKDNIDQAEKSLNSIGLSFQGLGEIVSFLAYQPFAALHGILDMISLGADALKVAWDSLKIAMEAVGQAAVWLWQNALVPAWNAIVVAANATWQALKTAWDAVIVAFNAVASAIQTAVNAIVASWNWVVSQASTLWNGVVAVFNTVRDGIKAALDAIAGFFQGLWNTVTSVWNAITSAISTAWDFIKSKLLEIQFIRDLITAFENIRAKVGEVFGFIRDFISQTWGTIKNLFNEIVGFLAGTFTTAWNNFRNAVEGVWNFIRLNVIQAAWDFIRARFNEVITFLDGTFTTAWNRFRDMLSALWNFIRMTVIQGAWDFIKARFNEVITFLDGVFTTAWNRFRDMLSTLWNFIRNNVIQAAWDFIKSVFNNTINFLDTTFTTAWNRFRDMLNGVWNAIKQFIQDRWNDLRGIFNEIINFVDTTFTQMWTRFRDTVNKLWQEIKDFINGRWGDLKGIFNQIISFVTGNLVQGFESAKKSILDIWNKLKDGIGGVWNTIYSTAVKVINDFGKLINKAIDVINKIPFVKIKERLPDPMISGGGGYQGISRSADGGEIAKRAIGGAVHGGRPGTDTVPAITKWGAKYMLDNGEHIFTKAEVNKAGGQASMYGFRSWLRTAPTNIVRKLMNTGDAPWLIRHPKSNLGRKGGFNEGGAVPGMYSGGALLMNGEYPGMGRDLGAWRGLAALAKKWGGGNLTSGYRPGDPLWHGSGLAADIGGYNQDTFASKAYSARSRLLELIHSTNRQNYGVSRGQPDGMNSQLWAEHKNHVHIAATVPATEALLQGKIPEGGGGLVSWLETQAGKAAKKALDALGNQAKNLVPGGDQIAPTTVRGVIDNVINTWKKYFDDKAGDAGGGTVPGTVAANQAQQYAQSRLKAFGWGQDQWGALQKLWEGESGWNPNAVNPSSGAYGIPQILPSSHGRPVAMGDYKGQVDWGLNYIKGRYGSPQRAYDFWLNHNPHWYAMGGGIGDLFGFRRRQHDRGSFYNGLTFPISQRFGMSKLGYKGGFSMGGGIFDQGGVLQPRSVAVNMGSKPEAVTTIPQMQAQVRELRRLSAQLSELIEAVDSVAPGVASGMLTTGRSILIKGRVRRGR